MEDVKERLDNENNFDEAVEVNNLENEKCILMGDFNVEPDGEVLLPIRERLLDTADISDSAKECTFPSDKPFKKIDYIFYRGLECESAETLHDVIADHLPVVAEFKAKK